MSIINMIIFFLVCILQIGQAFAFSVVPLQPHTKALATTATYQNKFSIASQSGVSNPCNRPTTHRFYLHDYLTMSKGEDSTGGMDDAAPNIPSNNSTIAEFQTNDISLSFVLTTIMSSIKEFKGDTIKHLDKQESIIKEFKDDTIKRLDKQETRLDSMNSRIDGMISRIDGIFILIIGIGGTLLSAKW
jgi:hypothetical protein